MQTVLSSLSSLHSLGVYFNKASDYLKLPWGSLNKMYLCGVVDVDSFRVTKTHVRASFGVAEWSRACYIFHVFETVILLRMRTILN